MIFPLCQLHVRKTCEGRKDNMSLSTFTPRCNSGKNILRMRHVKHGFPSSDLASHKRVRERERSETNVFDFIKGCAERSEYDIYKSIWSSLSRDAFMLFGMKSNTHFSLEIEGVTNSLLALSCTNHKGKAGGGSRCQVRRVVGSVFKAETVDESFEDLLMKYKQIQLELECIRKEERMALKEDEDALDQSPVGTDSNPPDVKPEEPVPAVTEKKVFQAFNLRPLRQKLLTPGERDALNASAILDIQVQEDEETQENSTMQNCVSQNLSDRLKNMNILLEDEDDLSELQLRLLALQSASRKWQQKEQQVMMESREKITKAVTVSQNKSTSPYKQALRKQQLRTWKLKHEQQTHKKEEEEERKRREDEIRKIRDLSNQDEQYNRFMKLVGSTHRSRSKSSDADHRKVVKQTLDTSGNLYQYDNYDEVAMETDSETNSPGTPPHHLVMCLLAFLWSPHLSDSSAPPPPLPPLPPPDETEQPPKPPFADEEEEEEMLLREELLKSLANKRAVKVEDASSSSGPPSPVLRSVVRPNTRNNLTAVSLNTIVSNTRVLKFVRAHPVPKAQFVLPRHKTVVVRLNASDDSDSDGESCSSTPSVFGGLESMIKEARRTVEAAKPKHSVSEKENNPVKIRDEMIRTSKLAVSSPVGSDSELDLMTRASDLQEKYSEHTSQLTADESLLKQLQQQEMKKREALKTAEAKVMRLKEQLLASEKIANANRLLLKKLHEQVQRVQHRVTVKKNQCMKLEKDLAHVQMFKRCKPAALQHSPLKVRRMDYSDTHYAELIAQKKRLQQLESEYARKIEKLKKAQALRQAEPRAAAPQAFPLPQPSLHDLTQDKLILSSEDVEAEDDVQQIPTTTANRRRSFRESGSFTKPNLSHLESPAASLVPVKHAKASSCDSAAGGLPELLPGLNVEDLRQRYQMCGRLSDVLWEETRSLRWLADHVPQMDFDPAVAHQNRTETKAEPFRPYRSPLLLFKSYRFSPYYRTKEKLSLRSLTYSNIIQPKKCFCRFDLTGTCNDDECLWQHMRNCMLTDSQLFQDILSYSLPLIGCEATSSTSDISSATEKYMKRLFGPNKDRMGTDQKAVLLMSKVNESLRHIPPFTTYKAQRRWRPEAPTSKTDAQDDEHHNGVDVTVPVQQHDAAVRERWPSTDVCVTQDDKRYFDSETDDISNLETSVLESPNDVQLWIKLAFKYLNQKDTSVSECLDAALNTLSRALEDNREDAEVWCHYLKLFSRRGSRDELQEMCEMAVEHSPHDNVWWTYMSVESAFEGKDYVCARLISHLLEMSRDGGSEIGSFQLFETLSFRVQLSVFTGRPHNALNILKSALYSESRPSVADGLTATHRCLMWLSYIHLTEFRRLPSCLYDPANSNPARIVCADVFLIPWRAASGFHTPADVIISLFQDAVMKCTDERLSSSEQIQTCFSLHWNLIHLYRQLDRRQEAVELCERLLAVCPLYCPLLDITSELHVSSGCADKAIDLWTRALSDSPCDAHVFYQLIVCLHAQILLNSFFIKSISKYISYILRVPTEDLLTAPTLRQHTDVTQQLPYLHLIHCFWQSVYSGVREAIDAFEKALGSVTQLDIIHKLWLDYVRLSSSSKVLGQQPSVREMKMFTGLVHRCLETVPSRLTLPFNSSLYWSCYSFHNKVISFYLDCFPQSQHSLVLERLQYIMPNNTELALLLYKWELYSSKHLVSVRTENALVTEITSVVDTRPTIAVEKEQKNRAEVQRLYQSALQNLPLSAALWTDCLLFEAAEGGKTDTLRKIIDKCQEVGVSLNEPLGLEPSQTQ
ncbi:zinc finger C3H1 domain-containing protein-like [Triplophysa rosa]|uniref:Zinc finger C3H1 domain-containing protein-like n=1 Tax=Triplophysa rosa TaxID=992332 RepID=A0A9W7X101_TRIRA|nr:zinc finger C3H1 domain-containing protein-like [Triplophysa rosa]